MEIIRDSNLKLEDLTAKNNMMMVVVSTKWCGPCNSMAPMLEELEKETPSVKLVKVDVTEDIPSFVTDMHIRSVPTMLFYKDKVLKNNINGSRTKEQLTKELSTLINS